MAVTQGNNQMGQAQHQVNMCHQPGLDAVMGTFFPFRRQNKMFRSKRDDENAKGEKQRRERTFRACVLLLSGS